MSDLIWAVVFTWLDGEGERSSSLLLVSSGEEEEDSPPSASITSLEVTFLKKKKGLVQWYPMHRVTH